MSVHQVHLIRALKTRRGCLQTGGYAVLPYATDYRENRVALDTNTLADNVDIENTVVSVVPTHGAVVRADYKTRVGVKVLMTLMRNGKAVPLALSLRPETGEQYRRREWSGLSERNASVRTG